MKSDSLIFLILLLFLTANSYCDIIPENSHSVGLCAKITNLEDYPDIALIGYVTGPTGLIPSYLISSDECLQKGYKFNTLTIYAAKKSYLSDKNITSVDWSKDKNVVKSSINIRFGALYFDNSNPIASIYDFYKIVGFTDTSVVLFKWKEINKFNNGKADSVVSYNYTEMTNLTSVFPDISMKLFPNPALKNFHIKLNNNYHGDISVKIITMDGKIVSSIIINKTTAALDYVVEAGNLAKGSYLVSIKAGNSVESKQIRLE